MKLLQRAKNLWRLSEYRVDNPSNPKITKDVVTIKRVPATIVKTQVVDVFEQEIQEDEARQ